MTAPGAAPDPAAFVRAHPRGAPVPSVPELRLYQADDAFRLWETTERELREAGFALPYWAFAWPGGVALARHLLDHPALVAGRRVLDLATGSGLVAIAGARAGAARVLASDVDPLALAAVELNAALNGVTVEPLLADLLDTPAHPALEDIEVALAGDVAYERPMATRVFAFLARLTARGVQVYVGDPGRPYLPTEHLAPLATYDVPVAPGLEDAEVKRTTVWRLEP